ncbi:MAG: NADH-quinone oxidoreductase subunit H [Thermoplasmata archaeon]|nr:NADH-quinone oxidoreductase subunit H [Thermoplasmata archaeon]
MVEYQSILDWINFPDPMSNPYYPFGDAYNLPYDISMKIWEILGGTIAWLLNLIFPNNGISGWLVCDMTANFFALVVFMILMFAVPFIGCLVSLWEERKILGRAMDRRGTMIGMWGFLQCVADGLKTFMKENVQSKAVDKMAFMWTCSLVIGVSVLLAIMVPLSGRWFVVDYGSGLLIIMALYALAPFFILVSGWAQNNKFTLIGGIRAAEMMLAYEIPILIIIATVALEAGTFNINGIVQAQYDTIPYFIPQFVGFITFLFCATAEAERAPFDLAEAESELVEGWQTEYSGMKWGLIMLADYLRGYVSCAMIVIMFFGGWNIPFIGDWNNYMPEFVFLLKAWFVFLLMILIRVGTARVRTDQILNLGWRVFMPLAVANLMIVLMLKVGGII